MSLSNYYFPHIKQLKTLSICGFLLNDVIQHITTIFIQILIRKMIWTAVKYYATQDFCVSKCQTEV